jgi:hypothetical protein
MGRQMILLRSKIKTARITGRIHVSGTLYSILEYAYFPNAFSALFLVALALMLIYLECIVPKIEKCFLLPFKYTPYRKELK